MKLKIARRVTAFLLSAVLAVTSVAPCFTTAYATNDIASSISSSSEISDGSLIYKQDQTSTSSSSAVGEEDTSANEDTSQPDNSETSEDSSSGSSSAASVVEDDSALTSEDSSSVAVDSDSTNDVSSSTAEDTSNSQGDVQEEAATEEVPTEEATQEVSFEALELKDPESNELIANIGDSVTLNTELNRDDVLVQYQWQKLYQPTGVKSNQQLFDYAEDSPTWYSFPVSDMTEAQAVEENPDAVWQGVEMYYAVKEALDTIGADSSNVQLAWKTPNFVLDGYGIKAAYDESGTLLVYAEKDGMEYVATLNEEGKWSFGEEAQEVAQSQWIDIDGATEASYTFTVDETSYETSYRCVVTITDEAYKQQCLDILAEQGVEVTEEQQAEEQTLVSVTYTVDSSIQQQSEIVTFAAISGNPALSSDAQWITGLTGSYEYITKDTYDRVTQWVKEGKVSQAQANAYWTKLGSSGFSSINYTNVLNENGFPTGQVRAYNGFDLTDGMLEVNSEWYGKTVYFRVASSGQKWESTGTAIKIPAYTNLTVGPDGSYTEAASGSKYKKAITMLNAFVPDTGSVYKGYLGVTAPNGWLKYSSDDTIHIQLYTVNCEEFNKDPQRYLMDAEGNYRMDSFAWGVCTYEEPDISGKAYWVLKDYVSQGYGIMVGHDTMYAYAGAYYDAFQTDLSESRISKDDTTTRYYSLNSWTPNTGHWYMNALMGSNAGNVNSGTVSPSDAPSMILSTGGSHGIYGKNIQYGTEEIHVVQTGWSAAQAQSTVKYRTPTNYPYAFSAGQTFGAAFTHTNQQAAFGTIWANYSGTNKGAIDYGYYDTPYYWTIDGKTGTNNFYLSGVGNFLMNQIGHLPTNSASTDESKLFTNSVMYISQRKQCEICAANQDGQETAHFVRRINSANATDVLTALQNGGSYWYPLDGCYLLTEDITLPSGWTPIKTFNGHWDSDVYKVNLNGAKALFENTVSGGENGWNLGTDKSKGVENVFNASMKRTTGIARVVGDLNDLFGTSTSYAGYTVKILGSDNTNKGMTAGEVFSCTVNSDSKYVISNLPCLYDGTNGVLTARVYDTNGREVTQYGKVIVRVSQAFWNNCETIPLELMDFTALGPGDKTIWVSQSASFEATVLTDDLDYCNNLQNNVVWQYKAPNGSWQDVNSAFTYNVEYKGYVTTGDPTTSGGKTVITVTNAPTSLTGYEFRIKYNVPGQSERYTTSGVLTVKPPEMATEITGDQTVWVRYMDKNGNAVDYSVASWDWQGTFGIGFNKPGYTMDNNNVATYKSTTTFNPKLTDGNIPVIEWKYRTGVIGAERVLGTVSYENGSLVWKLNDSELNAIKNAYGAWNLWIWTDNSLTQQADGSWVVTSYLKLNGCSTRMDIDTTRFFFRTTSQSSYGSGASAMTLTKSTNSSALMVEYEVDIKANEGVKNQVSDYGANWNFPNVKVYAPNGIRVGVVTFYHTNHAAGDYIWSNWLPDEIGIAYQTNDYLVLYSKSGNLLPASTWEAAFRNLVFYTEDSKDSIVDDVSWYIDEDGNTSKYALNVTGTWDTCVAENLPWTYANNVWQNPALVNQYANNKWTYPADFTSTFGVESTPNNLGKQWNNTYVDGANGKQYKYATFHVRRGYKMYAHKYIWVPAGLDKMTLDIGLWQATGINISFQVNGQEIGYSDSWGDSNRLYRTYNLNGVGGDGYLIVTFEEPVKYSMTEVRCTDDGGANSYWDSDVYGAYTNEYLLTALKVNSFSAQIRNFTRSNHSAVDFSEIWANKDVAPPPIVSKVDVWVGIDSDPNKVYDQKQSVAWLNVYAPNGGESDIRNGATMTYYKIVNGQRVAVASGSVAEMQQNSKCINAGSYVAVIRFDSSLNQNYNITGLNSNGELEKGFEIYQRPLHVHSKYLENDGKIRNIKQYDATQAGTIQDPIIDGILAGDDVNLNASKYLGMYSTSNAGETLTADGKTQTDRFKKLTEVSMSLTDTMTLQGESSQNYYIATTEFTGAIYRASLTAQVASSRTMYGQAVDYGAAGKPWHDTKAYLSSTLLANGEYVIASALNTNMCVDVAWADTADGANVQVWTKNEGLGQVFELVRNADMTYTIRNKYTGKVLDVAGGGVATAGTNVHQWTDYGLDNQRWYLLYAGNGYYYIKSKAGDVYLDVQGGVAQEGVNIQVWDFNGSNSQKFKFVSKDNAVADTTATEGCWLEIDGLKGNDTLTLDYVKSNFEVVGAKGLVVNETTPVGKYPLTYTGLNEANYPVLSNYIVGLFDGVQEVYAREIRVTVDDEERHVDNTEIPVTHSSFEMMNDDAESYTALGSDVDTEYSAMALQNDDTIQNTVLVQRAGGTEALVRTGVSAYSKLFEDADKKTTYYYNGSNIPYLTDWYVGCPAKYLDLEHDQSTYECEWCENYYGFELGTDHWHVTGYETIVNSDTTKGDTLTVATVTNPLGEQVQNYSLVYVAGGITVHPELRFQLKATVPMYVCMYGYGGDGEIVEPTTYGITNYSNGPIQVTNINVSNDGWILTNKNREDMQRGELSMKLGDTQLFIGDNKPQNPDNWIVEAGQDNLDGTQKVLPMHCYMAGGNVNERGESYVARVTYTIKEYGKTVPGETDVPIQDVIDGQPVTTVPGQS